METKSNTIIIFVTNLKEIESRFTKFKFVTLKAFNTENYTLYN